jgi:hypothetical protein
VQGCPARAVQGGRQLLGAAAHLGGVHPPTAGPAPSGMVKASPVSRSAYRGGVSIAGQRRQQAQQRLRAWAGFPVDRDPRPLVLLSPAVRAGPFPDGKAKLAFVRGLVEAAPGFPAELLQALRPHRQDAGPPLEPLVVTTATPGMAEVWTDRGRRELPAWNVHARGIPEPICQVLDPGTSQQAWRPPGLEDHDLYGDNATAARGAGGRTLTLRFVGAPRGFADYPRAEVLEAGAAVAVLPVEVDTGPPPWVLRALVGEWREVTTVLARPLGARVLLDGDGLPVLVPG